MHHTGIGCWTRRAQRAAIVAPGSPGTAHLAPEIHHGLTHIPPTATGRTGPAPGKPPRHNPPDIHVLGQYSLAVGEAADRSGRVGTDARQVSEVVGIRPAVLTDYSRGGMQVARTARIAKPLPLRKHLPQRRSSQIGSPRPARHPGLVVRNDPRHLSGLKHDLRHQDGPAITRIAPRKVVPLAAKPADECPYCTGIGGHRHPPSVPCPFGVWRPHGEITRRWRSRPRHRSRPEEAIERPCEGHPQEHSCVTAQE